MSDAVVDYYYEKTEYNEGEFFEMALKKAADRMMTKQLTNREIITIVAVVAIAAIVIVIIVAVSLWIIVVFVIFFAHFMVKAKKVKN